MEAYDEKGEKGTPLWLWPNLLSLDAPAVAVLWQVLFAQALNVGLSWGVHVMLGASVWLIYVVDRLFDAARLNEGAPATARHRFYRKHRFPFLGAVCVVAPLVAWGAVHWLPEGLAVRGLFFGVLVGWYFLYVAAMRRSERVIVPKEVICGGLFAMGTALATTFFLSTSGSPDLRSGLGFLAEGIQGVKETAFQLPVFLFGCLCCMNCALIATWEEREDALQDPAALTRWSRPALIPFPMTLALLASVSVAAFLFRRHELEAPIYLGVAGSAMALWVLERRAHELGANQRRVLVDAALFTPLLLVPFLR